MKLFSYKEYRGYLKFVKQFLKANGFKVKNLKFSRVFIGGSETRVVKCNCNKCLKSMPVVPNMVALAYKGIILRFYAGICEECNIAYILDKVDTEVLNKKG